MTHEALKKRVERLEDKNEVNPLDVVMWSISDCGIFGHCHVIGGKKTPCSDKEEIEIMRNQYERENKRIWGKGEYVPFNVYLEAFTYLAPEELKERQKVAIDRVKGS